MLEKSRPTYRSITSEALRRRIQKREQQIKVFSKLAKPLGPREGFKPTQDIYLGKLRRIVATASHSIQKATSELEYRESEKPIQRQLYQLGTLKDYLSHETITNGEEVFKKRLQTKRRKYEQKMTEQPAEQIIEDKKAQMEFSPRELVSVFSFLEQNSFFNTKLSNRPPHETIDKLASQMDHEDDTLDVSEVRLKAFQKIETFLLLDPESQKEEFEQMTSERRTIIEWIQGYFESKLPDIVDEFYRKSIANNRKISLDRKIEFVKTNDMLRKKLHPPATSDEE